MSEGVLTSILLRSIQNYSNYYEGRVITGLDQISGSGPANFNRMLYCPISLIRIWYKIALFNIYSNFVQSRAAKSIYNRTKN